MAAMMPLYANIACHFYQKTRNTNMQWLPNTSIPCRQRVLIVNPAMFSYIVRRTPQNWVLIQYKDVPPFLHLGWLYGTVMTKMLQVRSLMTRGVEKKHSEQASHEYTIVSTYTFPL